MTELEHPRVAALGNRFREIDAEMRALPLYNPAIGIAATGFRPLPGEGLIGVLVTPWFMNLTLLPEANDPVDPGRYGEGRNIDLPGGTRNFLYNGDPVTGVFWGHSLHSPMDAFKTRAEALAAARTALAAAMTPPEEVQRQIEAAAADPKAPPAAQGLSRRRFLRGG